MSLDKPEFILFVQHGWADDNRAMLSLAQSLTTETTPVIAPCLDIVQTWLRIDPLIQKVEDIAIKQIANYAGVPIRIIGHSMGGLIWLEVLHRHPEWWSQVHSLVLIASPVGGADLGRIIDPLKLGVGIASDLGKSRKDIAEAIALHIPTLVIAGDLDGGSDGTIPVESTRFPNAYFVKLQGLSHAVLRKHSLVAAAIRQFWLNTKDGAKIESNDVIRRLQAIPGMTDGHWRDLGKAKAIVPLNNGGSILIWRNLLGVDHIYVTSAKGECLYAGFVGWMHHHSLLQALEDIREAYGVSDRCTS